MTVQQLTEAWNQVTESFAALEKRIRSDEMKELLYSVSEPVEDVFNEYHALLTRRAEEAEEAKREKQRFEFLHLQLVGYAGKFLSFAKGKQECPCGAFKARQVNAVLRPLKELMEADTGVSLLLVSEEERNTYSDVSRLLCTYLGVSASYALRRFGLKYDVNGREVPDLRIGYGRRA